MSDVRLGTIFEYSLGGEQEEAVGAHDLEITSLFVLGEISSGPCDKEKHLQFRQIRFKKDKKNAKKDFGGSCL